MRGKRNLFKPGDRFGKLIITKVWSEMRSRLNCKNSKETKCECQCDCGSNPIIIPTRYIANGHKKSCGCLQNPKNSNHPSWKGYGEIYGTDWMDIKRSSIRGRTIPFELTIEQVWDLFLKQDRKCALSGVEIHFSKWNKRYAKIYGDERTASLDRIDSSKGYKIDNVQWVHKDINLMKMNLAQDVFIKWCKTVAIRCGSNHERL